MSQHQAVRKCNNKEGITNINKKNISRSKSNKKYAPSL